MSEIDELLPEIGLIGDEPLRESVREIWLECWRGSTWSRLTDVPKSRELPERGLIAHTRSVTRLALVAAETLQEIHGVPFDRDILLAGALLHDVSKLYENQPGPEGGAIHTAEGRLIQHGVFGSFKAWERGLPVELVHAILAHTRASRVLPQTWEAMIIHYTDYLDSDCLALVHGAPLLLHR